VTLLFDANLSPALVRLLTEVYPGSEHVDRVTARMTDEAIWRHAAKHGRIIVSKDTDFYSLAMVHGPPPKVIWLRVGNAGTMEIAALLRASRGVVAGFEADLEAGLLILGATSVDAAGGRDAM
jgi:predicted nuclease of predicted toxin-antitoxin system